MTNTETGDFIALRTVAVIQGLKRGENAGTQTVSNAELEKYESADIVKYRTVAVIQGAEKLYPVGVFIPPFLKERKKETEEEATEETEITVPAYKRVIGMILAVIVLIFGSLDKKGEAEAFSRLEFARLMTEPDPVFEEWIEEPAEEYIPESSDISEYYS